MRAKKIMTLVTAASLVMAPMTTMAPMTVLAAGGSVSTNTNSSGSASTSGSANANYADQEVYSVVLPTDKALDFVLDPQGLTTLVNGDSASKGTLESLSENRGKIVPIGTAMAANKSAQPITLSMNLVATVEGDASDTTSKSISNNTNFVTDPGTISDNTTNDILLTAIPSIDDTTTGDVSGYSASSKGFILSDGRSATGPDVLEFYLPEANYEASRSANGDWKLDYVDGGHGTGLTIGGFVNHRADWSAYQKSGKNRVKVTAVFGFKKAAGVESDYDLTTLSTNGYGLYSAVDGDDNALAAITFGEATSPTPSVKGTVTFSKATGATFKVNLGSGDTAETKVAKVEWLQDANAKTGTAISASYLDLKTPGQVTILKTAPIKTKTNGSYALRVTFDDKDDTTSIVTFNITD